jgi:ElaB/YqjD/DUF883 family membrane-anchored ribosome-binding protein
MATRSDELTEEIEYTRGRMDRTLDDIGERAGPGRLTERLKGAAANTRDTVMGVAGETRDQVAGTTGHAADAVRQRSQGNPIAAGLIAFGAGLLAGSVMPESPAEHRLAREVQRKAQGPLRDQLQESAGDVAHRVGDRLEEAKETVTEQGRHAKDEVSADVQDRTGQVREHARGAAEDVRDQAQEQGRHHTGQ